MRKREVTAISLNKKLLEEIERKRGLISRSRYIELLIKKGLSRGS